MRNARYSDRTYKYTPCAIMGYSFCLGCVNQSTASAQVFPMAGYGLDDSDVDEYLENSEDGALLLEPPPPALAAPASSHHRQLLITATAWRGPVEEASDDRCRLIPPSRYGLRSIFAIPPAALFRTCLPRAFASNPPNILART